MAPGTWDDGGTLEAALRRTHALAVRTGLGEAYRALGQLVQARGAAGAAAAREHCWQAVGHLEIARADHSDAGVEAALREASACFRATRATNDVLARVDPLADLGLTDRRRAAAETSFDELLAAYGGRDPDAAAPVVLGTGGDATTPEAALQVATVEVERLKREQQPPLGGPVVASDGGRPTPADALRAAAREVDRHKRWQQPPLDDDGLVRDGDGGG